jgi:hypothetical protein
VSNLLLFTIPGFLTLLILEQEHQLPGSTTFNPLRIAVHEVVAIARDVRQSRGLHSALGFLFAPPGWSPDGSSRTAAELRRGLKPHSSV